MKLPISHKPTPLHLMLNLLSEDDRKRIKSDILLYVVRDILFIILFMTLIVAILFIVSKRALDANYRDIVYAAKRAETEQSLFQQRVKELSTKSESLIRIQSTWQPISPFIASLSDGIRKPSTLSSAAIDIQKRTIEIIGHANTRTDVLTIQKSFEQLPFVASVDSPLTNILQSSDIDFQFTLHLRAANHAESK